jgi:hypothetical protein
MKQDIRWSRALSAYRWPANSPFVDDIMFGPYMGVGEPQ